MISVSPCNLAGNFPNRCDKFRIVQYIRMDPSDEGNEQKIKERYAMMQMNPDNVTPGWLAAFSFLLTVRVLTELGEKLLGIRNWADNSFNQYWSFLQYNF